MTETIVPRDGDFVRFDNGALMTISAVWGGACIEPVGGDYFDTGDGFIEATDETADGGRVFEWLGECLGYCQYPAAFDRYGMTAATCGAPAVAYRPDRMFVRYVCACHR